jgi:hypothetical protein
MEFKDFVIMAFFLGFAVFILFRSFKKKDICVGCNACCKINQKKR